MTRCKLGDHVSIKHGYAFDGEFFSDQDNGVVLVTPGNFALGGGYQDGKGKYYTGEYPAEFVLQPGDLIVTMTDLSKRIDTLGYGALVPSDGRVYLHNQRIGLVQLNDGQVDKYYLSFLMRSYDYQRSIAGSSTGSTVHHSSPKKICEYEFDLPPLETQRRIASILMAYDNLIENNRKQIALLEEVAQRLYKEWFIDLRFSGHEDVEIVDGLPQGWSRVSIEELGNYLNGYAFKPSDHYREGLPILKIRELKDGVGKDTPRNSGADVPERYRIHQGDIIFSWSATLAVDVWGEEDALLNQHLFKVTPRKAEAHEFVVQTLSSLVREMRGMTTGSTMSHLQRNKLKVIQTLMPSDEILEGYNAAASTLRKRITSAKQSLKLASEARDRLLPKLMSGEIEV